MKRRLDLEQRRHLYKRVKDHIRRAKLTYSQVADRTGFSAQRVYRLLNGHTEISGEDMEILAEAIGVSVGELYHDPNPVSNRRRAA